MNTSCTAGEPQPLRPQPLDPHAPPSAVAREPCFPSRARSPPSPVALPVAVHPAIACRISSYELHATLARRWRRDRGGASDSTGSQAAGSHVQTASTCASMSPPEQDGNGDLSYLFRLWHLGCFLWHHESCEPRATLELTPTRHQLLDLDKHPQPRNISPPTPNLKP